MNDGLVYHYTSQKGLLGIVGNSVIWASEIGYLNDSDEFQYTLNLGKEVKLIKSGALNALRINDVTKSNFLSRLDEMFDFLNDKRLSYVCSFSEKKDLLSQWRAYCPSSSGYSLGFSKEDLNELATMQDFRFEPCLYDRETQTKKVIDLFNKSIDKLLSPGEPEHGLNVAAWFMRELIALAPLFKNPSFEEEQEWRLVSAVVVKDEKVMFREGISTIVPFVDFKLELNELLTIKEIVIGPTPHPDLSHKSIFKLLNRKCGEGLTITESNIPYRAW